MGRVTVIEFQKPCEGRDPKNVILQRNFYKTEISLLRVWLIWKRRISKIYNLHFSAIKPTQCKSFLKWHIKLIKSEH